jgi:DNA-binding HxlR family transcriptional regulator
MLSANNYKKHQLIQLLGDYHTLMIIAQIELRGKETFNVIKSKIAINPTTLTKKIRSLEKNGIITHDTDAHGVKHYYTLTKKGKLLVPVLKSIEKVSQKLF